VLVAFGENDDRWSPNTQLDMARRLGASAIAIQDAGHTPNEDQPAATAHAVLDFWESVDARA
jgi:pimeloyl-ACP methyl ester carboxylesterase